MVLVQDRSIKWFAVGEKVDSLTVHLPSVVDMRPGIGATVILSMLFTLMMLESDVKVSLHDYILVSISVNYICSLQWTSLRSMLQATVPMVMFAWWEAPYSMKVE